MKIRKEARKENRVPLSSLNPGDAFKKSGEGCLYIKIECDAYIYGDKVTSVALDDGLAMTIILSDAEVIKVDATVVENY